MTLDVLANSAETWFQSECKHNAPDIIQIYSYTMTFNESFKHYSKDKEFCSLSTQEKDVVDFCKVSSPKGGSVKEFASQLGNTLSLHSYPYKNMTFVLWKVHELQIMLDINFKDALCNIFFLKRFLIPNQRCTNSNRFFLHCVKSNEKVFSL